MFIINLLIDKYLPCTKKRSMTLKENIMQFMTLFP